MLLRAAEHAKAARSYILWFQAIDIPENPAKIAASTEKLGKRLQRFLQFHDQQTAGLPGLNIIYKGMKARVTEKLVKNEDMTILKHQSCIIVGWNPHPADCLTKKGCERFLSNLPVCIYCKFQDASWVVDERLGVGVGLCIPSSALGF